jgi:hypothetical protein
MRSFRVGSPASTVPSIRVTTAMGFGQKVVIPFQNTMKRKDPRSG